VRLPAADWSKVEIFTWVGVGGTASVGAAAAVVGAGASVGAAGAVAAGASVGAAAAAVGAGALVGAAAAGAVVGAAGEGAAAGAAPPQAASSIARINPQASNGIVRFDMEILLIERGICTFETESTLHRAANNMGRLAWA
jgi:hypothetical protein